MRLRRVVTSSSQPIPLHIGTSVHLHPSEAISESSNLPGKNHVILRIELSIDVTADKFRNKICSYSLTRAVMVSYCIVQ